MRIHSVAVSMLLVGAAQAGAQGVDTAAHAVTVAAASRSTANSTATFTGPDTTKPVAGCWMGCTGSIHHVPSSEWQAAQFRRDARELVARRNEDPLAAHSNPSGPALVDPFASPLRPLPSRPAAASGGGGGGAASTMSTADARRYSIEEWRRAELGVADSIHHGALLRLAHLYDSAQAAGLSPDEQLRTLRMIDGLDRLNQLAWAERVLGVNRQADSAAGAISVNP